MADPTARVGENGTDSHRARRSPRAKPATALVIDPAKTDLMMVASVLDAEGFTVTTADSFAAARERLVAQPPTVLVTAVRLGAYNGLHLVLHGKHLRPGLAALVTSSIVDPVLQAEADAMGATLVPVPADHRTLAAAVVRTLAEVRRPVPSAPLRPPYERRIADRRRDGETRQPERRTADRRRATRAALQLESTTP